MEIGGLCRNGRTGNSAQRIAARSKTRSFGWRFAAGGARGMKLGGATPDREVPGRAISGARENAFGDAAVSTRMIFPVESVSNPSILYPLSSAVCPLSSIVYPLPSCNSLSGAAFGCASRLNRAALIGPLRRPQAFGGERLDPPAEVVDRAAAFEKFRQMTAGGGVGDCGKDRRKKDQRL